MPESRIRFPRWWGCEATMPSHWFLCKLEPSGAVNQRRCLEISGKFLELKVLHGSVPMCFTGSLGFTSICHKPFLPISIQPSALEAERPKQIGLVLLSPKCWQPPWCWTSGVVISKLSASQVQLAEVTGLCSIPKRIYRNYKMTEEALCTWVRKTLLSATVPSAPFPPYRKHSRRFLIMGVGNSSFNIV